MKDFFDLVDNLAETFGGYETAFIFSGLLIVSAYLFFQILQLDRAFNELDEMREERLKKDQLERKHINLTHLNDKK